MEWPNTLDIAEHAMLCCKGQARMLAATEESDDRLLLHPMTVINGDEVHPQESSLEAQTAMPQKSNKGSAATHLLLNPFAKVSTWPVPCECKANLGG